MEYSQIKEINCICNNKFNKEAFNKHYKECLSIKKRFSDLDTKISFLLKKYSNEKELNIVIFFFRKYIKLIKFLLKKKETEKMMQKEKEFKTNKNDKNKVKIKDNKKNENKLNYDKEKEDNKNEKNETKFCDDDKNKNNGDKKIDIQDKDNNKDNIFSKSYLNEFLQKQDQNSSNENDEKIENEKRYKEEAQEPSFKFNNNEAENDRSFLVNYFEGQLKGDDDNPAVLPNYQRKSNNEIMSKHEKLVEEQRKNFESWREDDKSLQNLKIIDLEKYNPYGLNLDLSLEEIFINQLVINCLHENKYLKLKIVSKIAIYNYIMFLGEDKNKDIIPISIYGADKYYSLNTDNWEKTQDFFNIGKYIIVINPNFVLYGNTMYEPKGTEGLVCQSPNETILFKDENDLNEFMDLLKKNNFDSLKKLGDKMIIRKCHEKSIYYYEKALNFKNDNLFIKAKILSLLSESYIQYHYYTKGLESINKSFDLYNEYIKNEKDKTDLAFITKLFTRKLTCILGLRNYKEAYEYSETIKKNKDLHNLYKLDESFINKFLKNNETEKLMKAINKGYQNYLGRYDIKEMIKEEKTDFYLNNGDYINKKLEISFDDKKGIKVIAKENISKGEYIIVEKAIYFCRAHDPNNNFESGIKISNPLHIISKIEYIDCVKNLITILKKPPMDYKDFFALYNGENLNQSYEERIKSLPENLISKLNPESFEKIFMTNKYITIRNFYYKYKIGIGLWVYLSVFNHSCLPNTTNFGIGDFIILTANKKIKKGEEITILYLSTPRYYKERKEVIKNIYNFECHCRLCEIEKKNREKYPEVLGQYDDFIDKLLKNTDTKQRRNIIKSFDSFLGNNKNNLSEYEIVEGYLEIQIACYDISNATKFYKFANKYLKNRDEECLNLSINKYLEFCEKKRSGKINSDIYNKAYKDEVDFYKTYFNLEEKETEFLLNENLVNKIEEEILIQSEINHINNISLNNFININK